MRQWETVKGLTFLFKANPSMPSNENIEVNLSMYFNKLIITLLYCHALIK